MTARAFPVLLVCVMAALTAANADARTLPKGTPYAAETVASIIGTADIQYVDDQTTYNVCESEPSTSHIKETYSFDWAVRYPQVTVPVADSRELGRAHKRLHVNAQPTAKGRGGLTTGDYTIDGDGPPTTDGNQAAGGSDCTQVPYGNPGRFSSSGKPDFTRQDVHGFFGDTRHLFFFAMPPLTADPATYTDSLGNTIGVYADAFTTALDEIPEPANLLLTKPNWNTVPADFSIDELKRLVHHSRLSLTPNVYRGTQDCSSPPNDTGTDTCSVTWTFRWTVHLRRRFLYRTKRAYRR